MVLHPIVKNIYHPCEDTNSVPIIFVYIKICRTFAATKFMFNTKQISKL